MVRFCRCGCCSDSFSRLVMLNAPIPDPGFNMVGYSTIWAMFGLLPANLMELLLWFAGVIPAII